MSGSLVDDKVGAGKPGMPREVASCESCHSASPHPYKKTYRRKHNPLQALTYLMIKIVIFPAIWISGIAYLLISFGLGDLVQGFGLDCMEYIAIVHTIAAIAIVVFVIAHVYLLTTGHSFIDHVRPMITGYDDVELTDEELAFLRQDEPDVIKE